jgi:serine/threonine protein kinase
MKRATGRNQTLTGQRALTGDRILLRPTGKAGGEGAIYQVQDDPTLLAKIYHPEQRSPERVAKLVAMLNDPPLDPLEPPVTIAWPVDAVVIDGEIVGFLMPRAVDTYALHEVYTPKTRRHRLPGLTYRYLLRMARNLAAAIDVLHSRGYVVGDVNESNVLAAPTALVTLVDTDSFQVFDAKRRQVFRCPVGKAEYTPPELQGQNFRERDRTPAQDCFGLAVLLFQLLMEGTHPFDGAFSGGGDPPAIDRRIAAGQFPHASQPGPWKPKPIAPQFGWLDPLLQTYFRQAFESQRPDDRPTAQQWAAALEAAEARLVLCSANAHHSHFGHLGSCPWCDRARQLKGRDPFPSPAAIRRGEHLQLAKPRRARPRVVATPPPKTASIQAIPIKPLPPVVTARSYWLAPGYSRSSAWVSTIGIGCCLLVSAAIVASRDLLDFSTPGVPPLIPRRTTALTPDQRRVAMAQFDTTRNQIQWLADELSQTARKQQPTLSIAEADRLAQGAIAQALDNRALYYGNGTIIGSTLPGSEATQEVLQVQWIEALLAYQKRTLGASFALGYFDPANLTLNRLNQDAQVNLLDALGGRSPVVPAARPSDRP